MEDFQGVNVDAMREEGLHYFRGVGFGGAGCGVEGVGVFECKAMGEEEGEEGEGSCSCGDREGGVGAGCGVGGGVGEEPVDEGGVGGGEGAARRWVRVRTFWREDANGTTFRGACTTHSKIGISPARPGFTGSFCSGRQPWS